MTRPTCAECRHFKPHAPDPRFGECRYRAPGASRRDIVTALDEVLVKVERTRDTHDAIAVLKAHRNRMAESPTRAAWPVLRSDEWCGDWTAREDA